MRLRRIKTVPLLAVVAGALTVGGLELSRHSCVPSARQMRDSVARWKSIGAPEKHAPRRMLSAEWQPVAWNDDSSSRGVVATDAAQPRTTTPVNRPVVRIVQPTVESMPADATPRNVILPPAIVTQARVNPRVVSATPLNSSAMVPDAPPQVPSRPVVRAAPPPSMSDLSVAEMKGSSDVPAEAADEPQSQEVPLPQDVPLSNRALVVRSIGPTQSAEEVPAVDVGAAQQPVVEREIFGPPPVVPANVASRSTHWPVNTLNQRPPAPPLDSSVVRIVPQKQAVSNDEKSLFVDSASQPQAGQEPQAAQAAATPGVSSDVVTSGPPRISFTQPPLVEPAPVVASPAPLRSHPSVAADVMSGPANVLSERRMAAALPPAAPQSSVAVQPGTGTAPRDPSVKVAPRPLPALATTQPRPIPVPNRVAPEAPKTAMARPAQPQGPMTPDRLPLAGGPPARPPYMMVVARRAQEHIDYGFNLAERGATYSSEAEFTEALLLVAQAIDAAEQTHSHSEAMAIGLRAFREADDFVPRDGVEPNVATVVATHQTPVLKRVATQQMPLLVAMQEYYSYAQFHLAVAGGHEPTAAAALYGLARLQSVLGSGSDVKKMMCGPKAIALHQAALVVDPMNYAAANELGVLLSRYGQWPEAQAAFMHSVAVSPCPENWKNLATSYDALGDKNASREAWQHFEIARRSKRSDSAGGGDRPYVRMVDPETFVRASGGTDPGDVAMGASTDSGPIQASAAMPRQASSQQQAAAPQPAPEKSQETQPLNWIKTKMSAAFSSAGRQNANGQQQRR